MLDAAWAINWVMKILLVILCFLCSQVWLEQRGHARELTELKLADEAQKGDTKLHSELLRLFDSRCCGD